MIHRLWIPALGLLGLLGPSGRVLPAFASEDKEALEVVDAEYVCMVNDARFAKKQVQVQVEGKDYYGCCQMCKERLTNDRSVRVAIDPVSGKEVDKATAVIGADSQDRVFYFENEKNLEKFNEGSKKK
jgi:YHS domain-containing protein